MSFCIVISSLFTFKFQQVVGEKPVIDKNMGIIYSTISRLIFGLKATAWAPVNEKLKEKCEVADSQWAAKERFSLVLSPFHMLVRDACIPKSFASTQVFCLTPTSAGTAQHKQHWLVIEGLLLSSVSLPAFVATFLKQCTSKKKRYFYFVNRQNSSVGGKRHFQTTARDISRHCHPWRKNLCPPDACHVLASKTVKAFSDGDLMRPCLTRPRQNPIKNPDKYLPMPMLG